jgi:hypothetical protein
LRAQIVGTLLIGSLVGSQQLVSAADWRPGSPADRAFRFFASLSARNLNVDAALEAIRPLPVGVDQKRRALWELPSEGELRPTREEAAKLASLQRILIYHKRHDVFEIKVVDVPQAGVVLHDRAVLLVSRQALRLLSPPELQAVVAHEAGHDYFWAEYEAIRDRADARARQELELRCDAIAVLTLLDLGRDPAPLISAMRKFTLYNQRLGADPNDERYPTVDERARFARAIAGVFRLRMAVKSYLVLWIAALAARGKSSSERESDRAHLAVWV